MGRARDRLLAFLSCGYVTQDIPKAGDHIEALGNGVRPQVLGAKRPQLCFAGALRRHFDGRFEHHQALYSSSARDPKRAFTVSRSQVENRAAPRWYALQDEGFDGFQVGFAATRQLSVVRGQAVVGAYRITEMLRSHRAILPSAHAAASSAGQASRPVSSYRTMPGDVPDVTCSA